MLYAPLSLVFAVQSVPRSVSVATTSAPLMAEPLGSVIVPTIDAVTSCAEAVGLMATSAISRERTSAKENVRRTLMAEPPGEYVCSTPTENQVIECYIAGE